MLDHWYDTTLFKAKNPREAKERLRKILQKTVTESVVDEIFGQVQSPAEGEDLSVNRETNETTL